MRDLLHHRFHSSIRLILLALSLFWTALEVRAQEKKPPDLSARSTMISEQMDSLVGPVDALIEHEEWAQARDLLDQLAKTVRKEYGKTSPAYATICQAYGQLMSDQELDEEALKWYQDALRIRGETLGITDPDYAQSLIGLGRTLAFLDRDDQAISALKEARTILEQPGQDPTLPYADLLVDLADQMADMGMEDDIHSLYTRALDITGRLVGKSHVDYGTILHRLADWYGLTARFDLAEETYLEAIDIFRNTPVKEQVSYGQLMNDLALLYVDSGQFENAEPLYRTALDIIGKASGQNSPEYAMILNNLAQLYVEIGQFDKAEMHFLEALKIIETTAGKDDPEYGNYQGNLGRLYLLAGRYDRAGAILTESLASTETTYGRDHEYYGIALHDLGQYHLATEDFIGARERFREASEVIAHVHGNTHPLHGHYLNYLADACVGLRDLTLAETLYREAIDILEQSLGTDDPWSIQAQSALARLYARQSRYQESDDILSDALPRERQRILQGIQFLSEAELADYIAVSRKGSATLFAQLLARPVAQADRLPGLCYDQVLFEKGFLMQAAHRLRSLSTSTPEAAAIQAELKGCRQRLAFELSRAGSEHQVVHDLEARSNALEQELARTVAGYTEAIRQVDWMEVQAALPPDAIALEFIHFRVNFPEPSETVQYAALLLRPGQSPPKFIPLGEEQQFDLLLRSDRVRKADYVNELYAWAERGMVRTDREQPSLYSLIWSGIEDQGLEGVNTIYFSPTGVFHRLNLGAIPMDEETMLSDRYHLVALGSTRQLAMPPPSGSPAGQALLVGGVAFTPESMPDADGPGLSVDKEPAAESRGENWSYLSWTEKEVERIAATLTAGGLITTTLSGQAATEDRIKALGTDGTSPDILHLATHGFFFPDPQDAVENKPRPLAFVGSDNPMIRSGLILAGGNYAWTHGSAPDPDSEDGILTAYEISQMDLPQTQLVVLSACETGLGDIQGNEGVYGLQRAFKIAGARYLIMSLWQVPDRQTMQFMTTFYQNWLGDGDPARRMDIPAAFRKTQREMRDRFFDPYSWAGFVLVE